MRLFVTLLLTWLALPVVAHEVRPAYLELREQDNGEVAVLWKTPMHGELRLALTPEFSDQAERTAPLVSRRTGAASVQTWRMRVTGGLRGQPLRIAGLEGTMTDVLVRAEFSDGGGWTRRLTPAEPEVEIPESESALEVAGVYLKLGVEHILIGIDHLLFVLALLLITAGGWKLVKTVTAFTLAHSITLALATLDWVSLPSAPVEAVIALSIVLLTAEILRAGRGQRGLSYRAPWLVAFIFGLVHGFGFAGALSEIGLPQGQIPLALLFFNVGVELGQLLFIATVLSLIMLLRRLPVRFPHTAGLAAPYAIGSLAMYWVIQRVASF